MNHRYFYDLKKIVLSALEAKVADSSGECFMVEARRNSQKWLYIILIFNDSQTFQIILHGGPL